MGDKGECSPGCVRYRRDSGGCGNAAMTGTCDRNGVKA